MGIDDLQLTPGLIGLLYPENLVSTDIPLHVAQAPSTVTKKTTVSAYPFLGKNKKAVCFLSYYPEAEYIPDPELAFLKRIMGACKLTLDDIALVNTARTTLVLEELRQQLRPDIVFLWGGIPPGIPEFSGMLDLTEKTIGGIRILPVLQTGAMSRENEEGKELKKKLWVELKKIFGL